MVKSPGQEKELMQTSDLSYVLEDTGMKWNIFSSILENKEQVCKTRPCTST